MALTAPDLHAISQRIVDAAAFPARVILFGSRARGDHSPASDVDLLVIEDGPVDRLAETMRLRDAIGPIELAVDLIVVSRESADARAQQRLSLVAKALQDGRVLAA